MAGGFPGNLYIELQKEIDLVTEGEETELDKTVLDQLADPLVHLIRNSIGHGIEAPEARVAAGKPRRGTIRLAAAHTGSTSAAAIGGVTVAAIRRRPGSRWAAAANGSRGAGAHVASPGS